MASKKDQQDAWARAAEVSDSMLGMQPYADDSMFFIMRYADKAKASCTYPTFPNRLSRARLSQSLTRRESQKTMRSKDHAQFMEAIQGMMELWRKPAEAVGGAQERARKAAELRQRSLDLVKDFPELERDFDRFVTASRATMRAFNPGEV